MQALHTFKRYPQPQSPYVLAITLVIIALSLSVTISDSHATPASPPTLDPTVNAWAKTYNGDHSSRARSVDKTSDGGYILAGSTNETSWTVPGTPPTTFQSSEGWLVKLDSSGNIQWQRSYRTGGRDTLYKVRQTSDGGYIAVGIILLPDGANANAWVMKTDSQGQVLWDSSYGGSQTDQANDVVQTIDGGFLVVGSATSSGTSQAWALRLSRAGTTMWQKGYNTTSSQGSANSIVATSDVGFVITGYYSSQIANAALSNLWVAKIDNLGNLIWQKTYGGAGANQAYSVIQTSDGGLAAAGYTSSYGDAISTIWVLKLDSQGGIMWQKAYGGGGSTTTNEAYSIAQLPDDGFVVSGFTTVFSSNPYLPGNLGAVLRLDSAGNVVWASAYGQGQLWQALPSPDSGVLLVGRTGVFGAALVVKLDINELIGPGCGLEYSLNATTVDSTAVPVASSLTSFSTKAQVYPVSAIVKDTAATVSVPCSQSLLITFAAADQSILQGLETDLIRVAVSSDNGPVTGATVTMDQHLIGNFSEATGQTDASGHFNTIYGAPNVSSATTIKINVTISKQGYWTSQKLIQLTVNPLQRISPIPSSNLWLSLILTGVTIGAIIAVTATYLVRGRRAKGARSSQNPGR